MSYELIAWLLVCFASLSFVNINIYLSLSLTLLGGFLLGMLLTNRFEKAFLLLAR